MLQRIRVSNYATRSFERCHENIQEEVGVRDNRAASPIQRLDTQFFLVAPAMNPSYGGSGNFDRTIRDNDLVAQVDIVIASSS